MSKKFLIVISILAAAIYISQRLKIELPSWINNYVNDLLCLPILLGFMTILFKWLKKEEFFKFSPFFIFFIAFYYSFYFEYYLPRHNQRYTSDIFDVLLYFMGGLLFYLADRKTSKKK